MSALLRVLPWVIALVGFCMSVGAVFSYNGRLEFLRGARTTLGTVTDNVLIPAHDYREKGRTETAPDAYVPQIQFTAEDNRPYSFLSRRARRTPEYAVGAQIEILYPLSDPSDAKLNDFNAIWGDTVTLAVMGISFLVVGVGMGVLWPRFFAVE